MLQQDDHCFFVSRDRRFSQITSWMRFATKGTRDQRRESDKLAPIPNVIEMFVSNCQKHYNR